VLDRYPSKDPSLSVKGPPTSLPPNAPTPPSQEPATRTRPEPGSIKPHSTTAGVTTGPSPAPPPPAASGLTPSPSPSTLIALERPFDVDEFSQLLGETSLKVTVPREDLPEVLRRVCDFMGFGIYVYAIHVRPAASESLKQFIVELQRVDFHPEARDWGPFKERGRSESPFGPDGVSR